MCVKKILCLSLAVISLLSLLSGCGASPAAPAAAPTPAPTETLQPLQAAPSPTAELPSGRETLRDFLLPQAPGTECYSSEGVSLDVSNASEGYLMLQYSGSAEKVRMQLHAPDGNVFNYHLHAGDYKSFPLTCGDGTYRVDVLENAYGSMYALVFSQSFSVQALDEFRGYLYPNCYVWYSPEDEAIALGMELSDRAENDLDYVGLVYDYVISHITYDDELARSVQSGYVPDIDRTLEQGKGICFDYASLMASMLRSQGVPTKLVFGYSGSIYHAWISVYLAEMGWVDNIIRFDGESWTLMDPTLGAGNSSENVQKYIGDGSHYTVKYYY